MILGIQQPHVLGGGRLEVPVPADVPLIPEPVPLHTPDGAPVDPPPGQPEVEDGGVLVDELGQRVELPGPYGEFLHVQPDVQSEVPLVILEGGQAVGEQTVRGGDLLAGVRVWLEDEPVELDPVGLGLVLLADVVDLRDAAGGQVQGRRVGRAPSQPGCFAQRRSLPQERTRVEVDRISVRDLPSVTGALHVPGRVKEYALRHGR
mmetsp:Transcript_37926/g.113318  ORF Transcript_37926/g.113318 Transcript_37926/m.113318 type:complete len:205 (-) Transcript_37926:337-951(-)